MENTITKSDIVALREEAGEHGDLEMVAICDKALSGNKTSWDYCEEVICYSRRELAEEG